MAKLSLSALVLASAAVSTTASAANLSVPIIGQAPETLAPTAKPAAVTPSPAVAQKTPNAQPVAAPAPVDVPKSSNPYSVPPSLSPQRQVKQQADQSARKPAPWETQANEVTPGNSVEVYGAQPSNAPAAYLPQAQPDKPARPPLRYTKRFEGRPLYRITLNQPRATITLYSGVCDAANRSELRQQLIDAGLDSRRKTILHPVYASLPSGREAGCWYFDKAGKFFRVNLENGQGEDFAREQVDRIK